MIRGSIGPPLIEGGVSLTSQDGRSIPYSLKTDYITNQKSKKIRDELKELGFTALAQSIDQTQKSQPQNKMTPIILYDPNHPRLQSVGILPAVEKFDEALEWKPKDIKLFSDQLCGLYFSGKIKPDEKDELIKRFFETQSDLDPKKINSQM